MPRVPAAVPRARRAHRAVRVQAHTPAAVTAVAVPAEEDTREEVAPVAEVTPGVVAEAAVEEVLLPEAAEEEPADNKKGGQSTTFLYVSAYVVIL